MARTKNEPYTPMQTAPVADAIGYDTDEEETSGVAFVQGGDGGEDEGEDDAGQLETELPEPMVAESAPVQEETPLYREATEKGGFVHEMYPEDVIVDPTFNGRLKPVKMTDKDVKEFASDILQRGQLQPARGYFDITGHVRLAFGFRRHAAFSLINSDRKPKDKLKMSIFLDPGMTEFTAYTANIAENKQRRENTAADTAHNVMRLSSEPYNMSGVQISKELHLSTASVSLYKKLAGVMTEQPRLVKLLEVGTINRQQGLDIAGLETPEKRLAAINEIAPEGASVHRPAATKKAVKKAIKNAKGDKSGDKVNLKTFLAFCDEEGTEANKQAGKVLEICAAFLRGEFKNKSFLTKLNAL